MYRITLTTLPFCSWRTQMRNSVDSSRQGLGVENLTYQVHDNSVSSMEASLKQLHQIGLVLTRVAAIRTRWMKVLGANPEGKVHDKARQKVEQFDRVLDK